jgi:hypothetical protein
MTDPLASLRSSLEAFGRAPLQVAFEGPAELKKYAANLAARFDSAVSDRPRSERMTPILRRLLASGEIATVQDVRYACYGMALVVGQSEQRILGNPNASGVLFARLNEIAVDKRRLRACYQGLLATYFSFDGRNADEPTATQWLKVRRFLQDNLSVVESLKPVPQWMQLLSQHINLFTDEPCERYSRQLLEGDKAEFQELTEGLGILDQSWLFIEAAYSTIRMACSRPGAEFVSKISAVLALIKEHPVIQDKGLAEILKRYSEVPGQPEESRLLQLSVSLWHNPLVSRNLVKWHLAGDNATAMVVRWLKSTLIDDFFEHLSADGATDKRRVKFWRRYVGSIENMYFALGGKARASNDADVVRLRKTMGDNLIRMEGGANTNNGFFMVMKDRVIAEFGEKGNAVYLFHRDHLPFELKGTISGTGKREWQGLPHVHYLRHDDNVHGSPRWEGRFKEFLARSLKVQPDEDASAPSPGRVMREPEAQRSGRTQFEEIRKFCAKRGIPVSVSQDEHLFVVRTGSTNPIVANQLTAWGFAYNRRVARWELRF